MGTSGDYMDWLGRLFEQHNTMLLRIARNRLGQYTDSQTEAEDIVQDVFVTASEKNIRDEKNPVGWLVKTTVNKCNNRYKLHLSNAAKEQMSANKLMVNQPARYNKLADGARDDESEAVSIDLTLQQGLSEEEYRLFNKYFIEGQSIEAISDLTNTSTGATRVRLCRLKKKARDIFLIFVVTILTSRYI